MRAIMLVLLLVGCNQGGLPAAGDGGADLSGGGDLAMAMVGAGQPCKDANECPKDVDPQYKAMCLAAPTFPGGYCAQPCAHGFGCPSPGMTCRSVAPAASATACFKDCKSDGDCRQMQGYKCCVPWNQFGGPSSVCYPGPCPI